MIQGRPPVTTSLAHRSKVPARCVRPGKEPAPPPSDNESWNGDINSHPLSLLVPVGHELSDESISILATLAEEHRQEQSAWKKHMVDSGEILAYDYAALERMTGEELAADYAHKEQAEEEAMRKFQARGVAANDAGPNVTPC
jgi:hypothetical protein